MKHILSLLSLSFAFAATPITAQQVPVADAVMTRKLTSPVPSSKIKPVITIRDNDVMYDCSEPGVATVFRADFNGTLIHIGVVRGDYTVFGWDLTDGVYNNALKHNVGSDKDREKIGRDLEKDLPKMQAYFKSIALAPFTIRSDWTVDAQIGDTSFTPVANWEYVGTHDINNPQIILKNNRSAGLAVVKKSDFLFPPPTSGKFRIGKKLDKLVALIEQDGMWIIQATDYLGEPPAKKVANK